MKLIPAVAVVALFAAPIVCAQDAKSYVGVITDTMCAANHKPMNIAPDSKCVKDCVRDGKTYKYALADGKGVYTLSDQQTPIPLAGAKVRVTGVLYTKTNILKVERIERVN